MISLCRALARRYDGYTGKMTARFNESKRAKEVRIAPRASVLRTWLLHVNEAADSLRGLTLDRCGKAWRLMSPATRGPFVHEASADVLPLPASAPEKSMEDINEAVEDGTEESIATTPSPDLFTKSKRAHARHLCINL